jgi:hypothetical protein
MDKFTLWIKSPSLGGIWLKYSGADSHKALSGEQKWRQAHGYETAITNSGERP